MELCLEHIAKAYGKHKVFEDFCVSFTPGIYGLLGPNGAGKSTMIHLITGNLRPDAGRICFDGQPIDALGKRYREKLGFMPQQQQPYANFTLEHFLWYMAALKGVPKKEARRQIEDLLFMVNLSDAARQRLGGFSGGMRQRALLAQALLGNPQLIILDEPTAGLDPKERIRFRNLLAQVAFDRIILLATHVVSDIEYIAKEVLLLSGGKIIAAGEPWALCETIGDKVFVIRTREECVPELEKKYKVVNIYKSRDEVFVRVLSDTVPAEERVEGDKPGLEDFYEYHFE